MSCVHYGYPDGWSLHGRWLYGGVRWMVVLSIEMKRRPGHAYADICVVMKVGSLSVQQACRLGVRLIELCC